MMRYNVFNVTALIVFALIHTPPRFIPHKFHIFLSIYSYIECGGTSAKQVTFCFFFPLMLQQLQTAFCLSAFFWFFIIFLFYFYQTEFSV